jgi:hypothetical protein
VVREAVHQLARPALIIISLGIVGVVLERRSQGITDARSAAPQEAPAQPTPSPRLAWLVGHWRAAPDTETGQLDFVWTKSAAGLHGELTETASDAPTLHLATYDIAPSDGAWILTLREAPGVYRFSGLRMGDEYVRFMWTSAPPTRTRLAAQAKRSKAGHRGLGPLASSGSIIFVEFRHLRHDRGQLFFRLRFGPQRSQAMQRSYSLVPVAGQSPR